MSVIMSIIDCPEQGGMKVEFYSNHDESIIFRQCVCCDEYHPIHIDVCPKTRKFIAREAQRQAQEENRARERKQKYAVAKEAQKKYLDDHLYSSNWKNNWRDRVGLIGGGVIYLLLVVILGFRQFAVLISIAIIGLWFLFWTWRHRKHEASVNGKAFSIFKSVMEEVQE